MVACETLFGEFERGLASRYFRDRVSDEERVLLCAMVRGIATVFPDPARPLRVVRDPADDYLVALARSAQADAIVTADRGPRPPRSRGARAPGGERPRGVRATCLLEA